MWLRAKKRVYLDWAAAAPVSPRVGHIFQKALLAYGNPGALHAEAVAGKKILEDARARIARLAEVKSSRVIFTSGATEANALGILGVVHARIKAGSKASELHVLYHPAAHASVIGAVAMLREEGVHTEPLAVAGSAIDIAGFEKQLRPETVLVVLEAVSGETGERYDTLAVRRVLDAYHKKHAVRVRMHVDASQAPLELSFTLAHLGADLVSLDAQKVGGIRGCGVLLLRSGVTLTPLMRGGGQEQGLRPGTENPALATAFALALEECQNARAGFSDRAL